jgi:hypothetical protein
LDLNGNGVAIHYPLCGKFKEMYMKQTTARVFAAGILALLVLAGCSNPATESFSEPAIEDTAGYGPEKITLYLTGGKGGGDSRAVAGLDSTLIPMTGKTNYVQVIVIKDSDGSIAGATDVRREKTSDATGSLKINGLDAGETYNVLVLQGHWDYTGITSGAYQYDTTKTPTLLGTGYTANQQVPTIGTKTVDVDMDPIWIDAKFTSQGLTVSGISPVEPAMTSKKPKATGLVPVGNWRIDFTVYRTENKGSPTGTQPGLADLAAAEGGTVTLPSLTPVLWIKDPVTADNPTPSLEVPTGTIGDLTQGTTAATSHVFTYNIPAAYTSGITRIGTEGAVNFNLSYIPVNKQAASDWDGEGVDFKTGISVPEWIIRNGVNDAPQNANTDFSSAIPTGTTTGVNWNGAVPFTVAYVTGTPPKNWTGGTVDDDGYSSAWRDPLFPNYTPPKVTLVNGAWHNVTSANANITFSTRGAFSNANWYYTTRVTGTYTDVPALSQFLDTTSTATPHGHVGSGLLSGSATVLTDFSKTIEIDDFQSATKYDAFLIAISGYVISRPLVISGAKGGFEFNITW